MTMTNDDDDYDCEHAITSTRGEVAQ